MDFRAWAAGAIVAYRVYLAHGSEKIGSTFPAFGQEAEMGGAGDADIGSLRDQRGQPVGDYRRRNRSGVSQIDEAHGDRDGGKALLLLLLLAALLHHSGWRGQNRPFLVLIGFSALQSIVLGLRWGYGVGELRYVLPILASCFPPLVLATMPASSSGMRICSACFFSA
jgi:hypothetical protein